MLSGAVRCLLRCSNTAFSESAARFLWIAQRSVYTVNSAVDKSSSGRPPTMVSMEAAAESKPGSKPWATSRVRSMLKRRCHYCYITRLDGRLHVRCTKHPRHNATEPFNVKLLW